MHDKGATEISRRSCVMITGWARLSKSGISYTQHNTTKLAAKECFLWLAFEKNKFVLILLFLPANATHVLVSKGAKGPKGAGWQKLR